jgi:hypothetical protein
MRSILLAGVIWGGALVGDILGAARRGYRSDGYLGLLGSELVLDGGLVSVLMSAWLGMLWRWSW